jgi:N-acetyl-gamma-glutamylphosphate reductase
MTAQELIELLQEHPDFKVEFIFAENKDATLNHRTFQNIEIADVGHSSKVILLTGEEKE